MIESLKIDTLTDLTSLVPERIQNMVLSLSKRLSINSRGTIFPIIRQIFSYFYISGLTKSDFSGMVLTPAYQNIHIMPYITATDEEKLYQALKKAPLRTQAMMRLALRLGIRDIDICNLRFSQIDWNHDQIVLEQKKTGVTQRLPLLEDVGNAIMDYILNEKT